MTHTATAVSTVTKLREFLQSIPQRHRGCAGVGGRAEEPPKGWASSAARVIRDQRRSSCISNRAQVELIQVNIAERHEKPTAAYIACTEHDLMWQLILYGLS
jgi:hypothetical protein